VSVLGERGTGGSLLVRLGFADRVATEAALVALGVWRDGRPVDDDAAALVTAAAEVADPDLAVAALARVLEAVEDPDELRTIRDGWDPTPWVAGPRHLYLKLRWREITGRRLAGDGTRGSVSPVPQAV